MLEIKVLGGLEVVRDGVPATLPPSRKTRALLAYLALARGRHRREQLCEHVLGRTGRPARVAALEPQQDPADRRRGFRRRVFGGPPECRAAHRGDRASTSWPRCPAPACAGAATDDLVDAAKSFRGPLLSDLDLSENSGFHTWLLGMREDARKLQARILRVVDRAARGNAGRGVALCARTGVR